jgi:hypothetical protein
MKLKLEQFANVERQITKGQRLRSLVGARSAPQARIPANNMTPSVRPTHWCRTPVVLCALAALAAAGCSGLAPKSETEARRVAQSVAAGYRPGGERPPLPNLSQPERFS